MKLGKRLAVAEVALFSPGMDEMVAHVFDPGEGGTEAPVQGLSQVWRGFSLTLAPEGEREASSRGV